MRSRGAPVEAVGMQPCDHIGWVYAGRDQFAALAFEFLSEGAVRGEKLMYVAEAPEPRGPRNLAATLAPDVLQVASLAEVYGPEGVVDAAAQRATFADVLAEARAAGFTGIRVAADNTALVLDDRRFHAWLGWELVADGFMAANPVTGLCAFDGDRVQVDRLRHLATLHPLSSSSCPKPQFRMFVDGDTVRVEGMLDAFGVRMVSRALRETPGYRAVVIDGTAGGTVMSPATMRALDSLARTGVDIMIVGDPEASWPAEHPGLTFLRPPPDHKGAAAV